MGELVNLNRVRKARDRAAAADAAQANRAKHGRTAAQRAADARTVAQREALLDAVRRDRPAEAGAGAPKPRP